MKIHLLALAVAVSLTAFSLPSQAISDKKVVGQINKVVEKMETCSAYLTQLAKDAEAMGRYAKEQADSLKNWVEEVPDDQVDNDQFKYKAELWRKVKDGISPQIKQYKSKCAKITEKLKSIKK